MVFQTRPFSVRFRVNGWEGNLELFDFGFPHARAFTEVIMEIISCIRRLERQSHRPAPETSIELGLFDGSLGARVSGQSLGRELFARRTRPKFETL